VGKRRSIEKKNLFPGVDKVFLIRGGMSLARRGRSEFRKEERTRRTGIEREKLFLPVEKAQLFRCHSGKGEKFSIEKKRIQETCCAQTSAGDSIPSDIGKGPRSEQKEACSICRKGRGMLQKASGRGGGISQNPAMYIYKQNGRKRHEEGMKFTREGKAKRIQGNIS